MIYVMLIYTKKLNQKIIIKGEKLNILINSLEVINDNS